MKKIIFAFAAVFAFAALFSCKQDNRPGEVHGTVSYRDRDIADAVVTLTGEQATYTYTTNSSGYYVIRDIVAGNYTVSVSYNGKAVDSYLLNYEKSENPHLVSVGVNGFHVRNIVIPDDEDMGWEDEDDDDYELPEAELPILAWYSIPGGEDATIENYQTLKECGFNLSFSHTTTLDEAVAALDLAEEAGIKVITPCPPENFDSFVNTVKDKPALYAYFLRDEPSSDEFPALATWANQVRTLDPGHGVYLNLLPSWAGESVYGAPYKDHIHDFIEKVKPEQVSFDFYPITFKNGEYKIHDEWWFSLEAIRSESQAAKLPFWAFALATAHSDYPVPTLADLRLQMYTNLAYGAQCLQYFTYWLPTGTQWDFHEAPISDEGLKTATYNVVKEMNEELQARAGVFVGCNVKLVRFAETVPYGGTKLTDYPYPLSSFNANGCRTLVSMIENGDYEYLMLVNCSNTKGYDYRIGFEKKVQVVNRDGSITPLDGKSAELYLEEGDCAIFCWKK